MIYPATSAPLFSVQEAHHTRRSLLLCFGIALTLFLISIAFSAQAQIFGSVNTGFSCGAGGGGGNILQSGSCPSSIEDGKIFSYFVCRMESIIGETFGSFYCQLQQKFFGPMSAVITLAITLFGIAFIIGVVPATARDSMLFLFKVAAVWGFATQADLLIGIAYNFFMGGLKEGIAVVVSGVFNPSDGGGASSIGGQGGERIYAYMDDMFKKFITYTTESAGADGNSSGGGSGGGASGGAGGSSEPCKNAVFALLALLAVAFPPLFFAGVFLLIKFIAFFLRAVFGYIYALIGISFLIVLAPVFLSFYFWKQTRDYSDRWIAHLASFALQMVIIFAFIAFILSIDVKSIGKDLMDLVVPYKQSVESPGARLPLKNMCTICEFTVTDSSGASVGGGNVPPGGSVKCKENPGKPIPPTSLFGPGKNSQGNTLMKLMAKVIMTLLILAYVLTALLDIVPTLAARLASASGITPGQLVGGSMKLPMEDAFGTFEKKFEQTMSQGGNPVEAFKQASAALVGGARDASGGIVTSDGLQQIFTKYLWNPIGSSR
jgi:type IV secretory pathway VirB6-like protein